MGFSREEYWSGLPFFSPRDLPEPGIKAGSPTLKLYSLGKFQVYNTVLLTLVTILYVRIFKFIYLTLNQPLPISTTPSPTPVFLPGESHGHRSLVGYSPHGHKQSDMTEAT